MFFRKLIHGAKVFGQAYRGSALVRRITHDIAKKEAVKAGKYLGSAAVTYYGGTRRSQSMPPTKITTVKVAPPSSKRFRSRSRSRGRSRTRKSASPPEYSTKRVRISSRSADPRHSSYKRSSGRAVYNGPSGGTAKSAPMKSVYGITHKLKKKGIHYVNEDGDILTTFFNSPCVGHTSVAQTTVVNVFWLSIFKALFLRCKVQVQNIDTTLDLEVGDLITFKYLSNEGANLSAESYTVAGSGVSLITLMTWATSNSRPWNALDVNGLAQEVVSWQNVSYFPVNTGLAGNIMKSPATLVLTHAKFTFYCKSTMKFQNRSVNDSLDEDRIDVVDNIPLYMVGYGGKGNGVKRRFPAATGSANASYVGDQDGLIAPGEDLMEPPRPEEFKLKRMSKQVIEPGTIVTDSLTSVFTVDVNKLFSRMGFDPRVTPASGDNKKFTTLGDYKFFGFDKMIETAFLNPEERALIKIAYERNRVNMGMITPGYSSISTQAYYFNGALNGVE